MKVVLKSIDFTIIFALKKFFIQKLKINDTVAYERPKEEKRIFSAETAYLMTDMLRTTAKNGTAKKLRSLPFEIAAKTGTGENEKGNVDAYALSYTTKDLSAVWLGNADNTPIPYTGGSLPCNLLLQINEYLYKNDQEQRLSPPSFQKPNGIQRLALDKISYYDTHNMLLADDLAPIEYCFFELFKKNAIPLKKSDFFSNPRISSPTIIYENGKIEISFNSPFTQLYEYKIERYDYVTHTTVYQGVYRENFIDNTIEKNKRYLYTITPYYKNIQGISTTLPAVNTAEIPTKDKIIDGNWWDY